MMKKWRELAWLVGLAALAALLIAFAILLALRLSAGAGAGGKRAARALFTAPPRWRRIWR